MSSLTRCFLLRLALLSLLSLVAAREPTVDENAVIDLQNQARAGAGLPPLAFDLRLYNAACGHSDRQAAANQMTHQVSGEPGLADRVGNIGWLWLGENVGVGGCDSSLFKAWWNSQGHHDNIMSPQGNAVGVCSARAASSACYWTVVFAKLSGPAIPFPPTPVGAVAVSGPLQFFSLPVPVRLFDTRLSSPIASGSTRRFSAGNIISADAAAFSATLQAVDPIGSGYLTVWPSSAAQPLASCINYQPGLVVSASLYSSVGAGGKFDVFASTTVQVLVDITGYFAPPRAGGMWFFPLPPARVLDTRPSLSPVQSGSTYPFRGVAGIPGNAGAVSYTTAMVDAPASGYLTIWGEGGQPFATAGLFTGGITGETAGIAAVGGDGNVRFYASSPVHLALDVDGYFSASGNGYGYVPLLSPVRLLDTREGAAAPFDGAGEFILQVTGSVIPGNAAVLVCTATGVGRNVPGYGTLYPYRAGQPRPVVSQIQFNVDSKQAVMALALNVPIGDGGKIGIYLVAPGEIILDAVGYYMPKDAPIVARADAASSSSSSSSASSPSHLSSGAVAAIVICAVVVAVAILAVVLIVLIRARRNQKKTADAALYQNMIVSSS